MAVYRLTRTPDVPGGQLVGADSAAHAVALARYQLQQYGHTGWPCNKEPVYVHLLEQQRRAASELTQHDQAAGVYGAPPALVHEHQWEFYDSDATYKEIDACDCGLWRNHLHRCRVNEYGQHQCVLASWHTHTDNHGPHED